MNMDDYNAGMIQGQFIQSCQESAKDIQTKREIQESMTLETVALTKRLKEAENSRDEWKVYAKQLEAVIEGFAANRDALREEIVHCTAPHPLRETAEQMKIYDAAYIAEAKKNGLPESQWSEKVLARRDKK